MEPSVIYEDDDVLVLDKPAGLVVHGDGRTQETTLSDWILRHYPSLEKVGEPFVTLDGKIFPRPGIVHRLDRETSGLIIVAKTAVAYEYLKNEFKEHRVKKEYLALVYGHLETESGLIDKPIGKSKQDFRLREAGPKAGGTMREARTVWEMKERLIDSEGHLYSLVYVRPETGRTHQIRAHMRSVGFPVVCDSMYAPGRLCPAPLLRHGLHACRLDLSLPSGVRKSFEAPLPTDFMAALAGLSKV
jgi:23S rRNA pseudouridine1911/1915/1917 synthase